MKETGWPTSTRFSPLRIFPFFCGHAVLYIYGLNEKHLASSRSVPSFTPFFLKLFSATKHPSIHCTAVLPLCPLFSLSPPVLIETSVKIQIFHRLSMHPPPSALRIAGKCRKNGRRFFGRPHKRGKPQRLTWGEEKGGHGDDLRQPFPVYNVYNNHLNLECSPS